MNATTALLMLELIDLAASGLQMYGETKERYERLSAKVRQMVEEDRDPTADEFAELFAESASLSERLKAALAAKEGEGETPVPVVTEEPT